MPATGWGSSQRDDTTRGADTRQAGQLLVDGGNANVVCDEIEADILRASCSRGDPRLPPCLGQIHRAPNCRGLAVRASNSRLPQTVHRTRNSLSLVCSPNSSIARLMCISLRWPQTFGPPPYRACLPGPTHQISSSVSPCRTACAIVILRAVRIRPANRFVASRTTCARILSPDFRMIIKEGAPVSGGPFSSWPVPRSTGPTPWISMRNLGGKTLGRTQQRVSRAEILAYRKQIGVREAHTKSIDQRSGDSLSAVAASGLGLVMLRVEIIW